MGRWLWFVLDESGEIVMRVKRLVDVDDMRVEVEGFMPLDEFLKKLAKALREEVVTEVKLYVPGKEELQRVEEALRARG